MKLSRPITDKSLHDQAVEKKKESRFRGSLAVGLLSIPLHIALRVYVYMTLAFHEAGAPCSSHSMSFMLSMPQLSRFIVVLVLRVE